MLDNDGNIVETTVEEEGADETRADGDDGGGDDNETDVSNHNSPK